MAMFSCCLFDIVYLVWYLCMSFKLYQVIDDESDPGLRGVPLRTPEAVLSHRVIQPVSAVRQAVEEAMLAQVVTHAAKTLVPVINE